MTAHPIDVAIVDASAVAKSGIRSYEKSYVRLRFDTPSTVNSTSLTGQTGGIYVASLQADFDLDTADTTTADDGENCLIDSAGNRFKRLVTGAGGTVTQATSKSTGVTLNKATGEITMDAAALSAATIVSFVLTNSLIAANDLLLLNHASAGTPGAYSLNARCAANSATIDVRNNTAGSLSEAIVIRFALIKGATT